MTPIRDQQQVAPRRQVGDARHAECVVHPIAHQRIRRHEPDPRGQRRQRSTPPRCFQAPRRRVPARRAPRPPRTRRAPPLGHRNPPLAAPAAPRPAAPPSSRAPASRGWLHGAIGTSSFRASTSTWHRSWRNGPPITASSTSCRSSRLIAVRVSAIARRTTLPGWRAWKIGSNDGTTDSPGTGLADQRQHAAGPVPQRLQVPLERLQCQHDTRRLLAHPLSRHRQSSIAGRPGEQWLSEMLFERSDLLAHGGLRYAKAARGSREAALVDDRQERLKVSEQRRRKADRHRQHARPSVEGGAPPV